MFVNIQHPGETPERAQRSGRPLRDLELARRRDGRPRSATVVIRKNDGGVIGA